MIDSSLLSSGLMLDSGTNKLMLNVGSGLSCVNGLLEIIKEEGSPFQLSARGLGFYPSDLHLTNWIASGLGSENFHFTSGLVFDKGNLELSIDIGNEYFWPRLVESLVASGFVRNT